MDKRIYNLLKYINEQGYECYIVGGFVRDYLLNTSSNDYDLCSNANPDKIVSLLDNYNIISKNYTTVTLLIDELKVEITSYRQELEYQNRKPYKYKLIDCLEDDLQRRDFTINAICMDKDEKIIDMVNGVSDLNNKLIRLIGDIDIKVKEDPLRILRALRFSVSLNFKLTNDLKKGINKYKYLLKDLSYERKKLEIDKLLQIKKLNILVEYELADILELDLKQIEYFSNTFLTWFLIDKNKKYLVMKKEKRMVEQIVKLNSLGLTNYNMYKYGFEISYLVGLLKHIDIKEQYNNLPIKKRQDIKISSLELSQFFSNKDFNKIYEHLEKQIIEKELMNNHDIILSYLNNLKHNI